jgi:hypothetical protein
VPAQSRPTLDELAAAIKGIRFAIEAEQTF